MAKKITLTEEQRQNIAHIRALNKYETAEALGVSVDYLRRLRELKLIEAIKLGNSYMYPQTAIQRFYDEFQGVDLSGENLAIIAQERAKKKALDKRLKG